MKTAREKFSHSSKAKQATVLPACIQSTDTQMER